MRIARLAEKVLRFPDHGFYGAAAAAARACLQLLEHLVESLQLRFGKFAMLQQGFAKVRRIDARNQARQGLCHQLFRNVDFL